jgi:hypothetical protein
MKKTLTTLALSVIWSIALAYQGADKDNPSLRQALQDFGIPQSMAHAEDLDFRVSSGTAFNADCKKATQASDKPAPACDSAATLFAYYAIARDADSLSQNFYLFRKIDGAWRGGRFGWPNDDNQDGLEDVIGCRGGSLFPSVSDGLTLVTGSNGPSASCTMVFNAELKPLITLSGLDAKPLGSSHIILRQNLIHFSTQRSLDIWLVDLKRKTFRKIFPSTYEFPARRDFRLAMAKRLKTCEASPKCYEKLAQGKLPNLGGLNENASEFFYAPIFEALMFEVTVIDELEKSLFPPEPWTAPVYIAIYRKLFQQPEVRYVDRQRFVEKFGEAALKAPPTQGILDWVWALDEK